MKRSLYSLGILISLIVFISLSGCYYDNEEELYQYVNAQQCDTTHVTFSGTIMPIFNTYCNSCHNTSMASGGIILDTYAGTSVVAANGHLWGSVAWLQGFYAMPQNTSKLSDCDLNKIKAWLNSGYPNN